MSCQKEILINKVITAAYRVFDALGTGVLERNYHLALETELRFLGIPFVSGYRCELVYRGVSCRPYYVDLFVNKELVVELKACKVIEQGHFAQTYNYMHITGVKDGVIINFGGTRVNVRRLRL